MTLAKYTKSESDIQSLLEKKDNHKCSKCGQAITIGDLAWNNRCTEAGTGHCSVFAECPKCYTEIFYIESWYPSIDDLYDLYYVIDMEIDDETKN